MRTRIALTAAGAALGLGLALRATRSGGSTGTEALAGLPGDVLVPDATVSITRAISIAAPPERVWPWLVQLGQGRGGFYSHDALENLAGLDVHSADRIDPRLQDLAVGDPVHLAREVALRVAALEPGAHLVLFGAPEPGEPEVMPFRFSWAFVLRPGEADATGVPGTRLLVRERYRPRDVAARLMVELVLSVSGLMSSRMLRGIRERAERVPAPQPVSR
ncbi:MULTISPECIES: hypothetical protein [Pseudonocardia]|uniref:Polyketide cyclase / dehydrase and lipid transport n=2 Tax=Pseudonocardia TaxID=1847 RepID=A0A1Y2N3J4_PSEAH|nr:MULTISPECIES: hypothetical protein [Pseudonocardia]OSY41751.1 hypothetical protein BG845_01779 [Pseudonocardia autotrophica]TDN71197.1 hypothetical protein C8E95_0224 [Pseudonocardia autotrophica]BBG01867.1 hypothetical protein Pdca_30760 [Pseudonocardia autotrophica]GEC23033.1 hypothetical protein PSA01_00620 [Pseudonocardia saturnea]